MRPPLLAAAQSAFTGSTAGLNKAGVKAPRVSRAWGWGGAGGLQGRMAPMHATHGMRPVRSTWPCMPLCLVDGLACLTCCPTQASVRMEVVAQKKIRVAINGFGRIGRNFLRCWEGRQNTLLDVVAINDSGGVKQASHLLKYDSILGTFNADVKVVDENSISVNGKVIRIVSSRDPLTLPWKDLNIDLVIEGTGVFIDQKGAGKHITVSAQQRGR